MEADLEERLIEWRRNLHQRPELAGEEKWTTDYIRSQLVGLGLEVAEGDGAGWLAARIPGGASEPGILLRAQLDGSPIHEQTGLDFASQAPGCTHACGQDAQMAMLLGAAALLTEQQSDSSREVLLLFQSSKATKSAIEGGLLKAYPCVAALSCYVASSLRVGAVAARAGQAWAACNTLRFSVKHREPGRPWRSSQEAHNPLLAAAAIVKGLAPITRQMRLLGSHASCVPVQLQSEASTNAALPGATVSARLYTFDSGQRDLATRRALDLAERVDSAFDTRSDFSLGEEMPGLSNDPDITARALASIWYSLAEEGQILELPPVPSSDSFAELLRVVPGTYLGVGGAKSDREFLARGTPWFDIDERALMLGARALQSACNGLLATSSPHS